MTEPGQLDVAPPRRSPFRNLSLVWLVPVAALIVTLAIAWQSYADRGILIEISFNDAQGIVPEESVLRYRNVEIGRVEEVEFSDDLSHVIVGVRVDAEIAPYIDEDASFWVVRPQVTSRGIEGLSTVLSGVYIEGAWDRVPGEQGFAFNGLDAPPLVQPGREGKRITLRTEDGTTIRQGAPVVYRGVTVGALEEPRLTLTGDAVLVDAFISAPYDGLLTEGTRFWDISGFTVSLGASGFGVDFDSFASILSGGLTFDDIYKGGAGVDAGYIFDIFPDEDEARSSLFANSSVDAVWFTLYFNESVAGLQAGADVTYRGLSVGQVEGLVSRVEETELGPLVELAVNISIEPERLGLELGAVPEDVVSIIARSVENGMRARLATVSFLNSELIVELAELPDALPAVLDMEGEPYPVIPTAPSDLPDMTTTAEGLLDRLNSLPIEDVMNQAVSLMASIEDVARADGTRQAPDEVLGLIQDTRALIAAEATQELPAELRAVVGDLRAVVSDLREGGAAESLTRSLRNLDRIAADVAVASEEVPGLLEELRVLTRKASALEAETLIEEARAALENLNTVLGDEATQALPASAQAAMADVQAILSDLQAGGAGESLAASLASLETVSADLAEGSDAIAPLLEELRALGEKANAVDLAALSDSAAGALSSLDGLLADEATRNLPPALTAALDEVRGAVADLRAGGAVDSLTASLANLETVSADLAEGSDGIPQIIEDVQGIAERTAALDTEGLVASARSVLDSADAFLSSDETQSLPPALTAALNQVELALAELREGGAVENVNATLQSTEEAMDAIAAAARDLPDLSRRLNRLVAQAEGIAAAYGDQSKFNVETLTALRELQRAARSVTELARAIERSPNSLIFGR